MTGLPLCPLPCTFCKVCKTNQLPLSQARVSGACHIIQKPQWPKLAMIMANIGLHQQHDKVSRIVSGMSARGCGAHCVTCNYYSAASLAAHQLQTCVHVGFHWSTHCLVRHGERRREAPAAGLTCRQRFSNPFHCSGRILLFLFISKLSTLFRVRYVVLHGRSRGRNTPGLVLPQGCCQKRIGLFLAGGWGTHAGR